MVERLTECIDSHLLDNGETVSEYSLNSKIKFNDFSCMDIPNAVYDKLGILEDILEECGIETVEELRNLIANYKTLPILTEERIKEIAVNEQRKVFQSMIKEITEKECNNLYNEINTWKKACELACDDLGLYEDVTTTQLKMKCYYQQAKKEGNDE